MNEEPTTLLLVLHEVQKGSTIPIPIVVDETKPSRPAHSSDAAYVAIAIDAFPDDSPGLGQ